MGSAVLTRVSLLILSTQAESAEIFGSEFTELFPDLSASDKPEATLAMHQSPDGSMYWMAGQEGILLKVGASSPSSSSTVMDLSGGIFYESYEEGLLDFAFSPMFDTNSFFYVSWTVSDDYTKNRLSKFQYFAEDPDATRDSEEVLLETNERSTFMHNGGWVGFKPSDYGTNANYHELYWALGDSGPHEDTNNNGQRTDTFFGSMVRISVPSDGTGYSVPTGNYPSAELPEICAIGFRNIWRCGFDRLTDELYCGNVGHEYIESIYNIECGNNYGWVRFEGSRCTEYSEEVYGSCVDADRSGYTFPFFEYCHYDFDSSPSSQDVYTNENDLCGDRSIVGNTVIGGYVYRGQSYADLIYGAYVFADFTAMNIFYILMNEDGTSTSGTIISDGSVVVYSFFEDIDGELFIIDDSNNIYYLPCGDLCDEDESTTDDDSFAYTYLGCYADDANRVLSGNALYHNNFITAEKMKQTYSQISPLLSLNQVVPTINFAQFCAAACEGFTYFGTQFGRECFCGDATDDPTSLGVATCDTSCTGDSAQICGGFWAMSVYEFAA